MALTLWTVGLAYHSLVGGRQSVHDVVLSLGFEKSARLGVDLGAARTVAAKAEAAAPADGPSADAKADDNEVHEVQREQTRRVDEVTVRRLSLGIDRVVGRIGRGGVRAGGVVQRIIRRVQRVDVFNSF
jgi:hypothetical protein